MSLFLSILIGLLLGVTTLAAQAPTPVSTPISTPTPAIPEPIVAVFAAGAMVHSEGVFSTDLIQGVPALPRLRVAPAPQVGAWSQLSRTSVVQMLRMAGVDLSAVRWTGPESARVSRAMRDLGEAEVRDRITQELQRRFARNGGEIEVRLSRPWRSVSIPDESLDIRLQDLPAAGLQSLVSLKFEILAGGDAVGSWFQPIQVRHWCEVPVAAGALRRGQPLVDAETVLERRDILSARGFSRHCPQPLRITNWPRASPQVRPCPIEASDSKRWFFGGVGSMPESKRERWRSPPRLRPWRTDILGRASGCAIRSRNENSEGSFRARTRC